VLGIIWRHLVQIFKFFGNRWATKKEVGQQLGLAVHPAVLKPRLPQPSRKLVTVHQKDKSNQVGPAARHFVKA
jgi:hypothetical protein